MLTVSVTVSTLWCLLRIGISSRLSIRVPAVLSILLIASLVVRVRLTVAASVVPSVILEAQVSIAVHDDIQSIACAIGVSSFVATMQCGEKSRLQPFVPDGQQKAPKKA